MKNDKILLVSTRLTALQQHLRRYWLGCLLALLVALIWMRGSFVYAAPLHQTVPPPTPTQDPGPAPTATAVPDDDDDDDDDNEPPTPTPTTIVQPAPTQAQPTQAPTQPAQPQPQPTVAEGALTGVVAVARLNVRQGPGTNFGVVGIAVSGQRLTILSRNVVGDWWHICCVNGTTLDGWVATQFVQPNFDLGQANTLISVDETLSEAPTEPTATPTLVPGSVPTTTTAIPVLQLQVQQDPPYTWQGQTLTLTYQIDNRSEVAATAVELRNELPAELTFVDAPSLDAGAFVTETTDLGRTVVVVRWPELQAGSTVTAHVQVRLAESIADGTVVDNLTVVVADTAQPITAGISIGMPPTSLPDFR